jgi:NTP pyrophosphatase (non-canonical NTP hydrolase)
MEKLTPSQTEIINILSEECAEVIQIISKIHRFGLHSCHPSEPAVSNLDNLHQEVGDILAMIALCVDFGLLEEHNLEIASKKKMEKLKKWSNIFKDNKNVV